MKASVALRRMLGAAILTVFLIPLITSSVPGPRASVRPMAMAGACCAEKPCCVAAHACGTGECPMVAAASPTAPTAPTTTTATAATAAREASPRLAASCPGPAPATTPSDRDPMLAAPMVPPSTQPTPVLADMSFDTAAPTRSTAPSVPPPRV